MVCRLISDGFCSVFPIEQLFQFSPDELQLILCGEQSPQWTKEDIISYTEPKLGYTRERYGDSVDWNNYVAFSSREIQISCWEVYNTRLVK